VLHEARGGDEMARTTAAAPSRLLSVEELSALLQVPIQTIYHWRYRGDGPRPMRIGRHLRFDPADVARWLETKKAAV
jgi:excisionase family DNA binding protein